MLTCKLEIVKFSIKFIKQFLNNREIAYKMVKKAAERGLIKFPFLAIG